MKRVAIKWSYLLALIAFGVWLFDVFFGGNVYLRGEGLILGQPAVVAAEYNVTVRDVLVKEGSSRRGAGGRTDSFAADRRGAREAEFRSSGTRRSFGGHGSSKGSGRCHIGCGRTSRGGCPRKQEPARRKLQEGIAPGAYPHGRRGAGLPRAEGCGSIARGETRAHRPNENADGRHRASRSGAVRSTGFVRSRTVACAHRRHRQYGVGPSWRGGARGRCAVGVRGRPSVCHRLGSGWALVQIGRRSTGIDRCGGWCAAWNDCKDRHGGVGLAARISKGICTDRTPSIGLD